MEEEEDRISSLPEPLIQHILSFLPSTNEAIQTSLLSKTFRNQWTHVSVLKLNSSGMSPKKFCEFIYNALILVHDFSKIKKFHIQSDCYLDFLDNPIRNMNAEEVILDIGYRNYNSLPEFRNRCYTRLAEFLLENPSLVKMRMYNCDFDSVANVTVSFGHLKTLKIEDCRLSSPKTIENILRGSPSLEFLEFANNYVDASDYNYVIASESLKKLVLENTLLLENWTSRRVVEISCPNLDELKILDRFKDVYMLKYSLISATLDYDFEYYSSNSNGDQIDFIQQLQHAKELNFGRRFIQALSDLREAGVSFPLCNNKSLTLDNPVFRKHHGGIVSALRSSHQLEKLIIKLPIYKSQTTVGRLPNLPSNTGRSYWTAKGRESKYRQLVSHLKTVEIIGLSKQDDKYSLVVHFIKFLLKNAMVLEKLVVILA